MAHGGIVIDSTANVDNDRTRRAGQVIEASSCIHTTTHGSGGNVLDVVCDVDP